MRNEPFVIERTVHAPVDMVWDALTKDTQMKEWYFDIPGFKPQVGYQFQFEGTNEGRTFLHLCEITEVIVNKKLSYSWRYKGFEGNSLVTFELFPGDQKTLVKLTHEGIETFPANNPDFAKESFAAGWTQIIGTGLPGFVERN